MRRSLLRSKSRFICGACQDQQQFAGRRTFASSKLPPDVYDVVTVGGGPVGLSLLAALKASPSTQHLKTALIETHDLSRSRQWKLSSDQYSNRASSLTPSSVSFLEEIGAWSHIDQNRIQPYDEMQVYDASSDASVQFDWKAEAQKYNSPPRIVATMTENSHLTKALLTRISEIEADSSLLESTSVSSIENGQDDPNGLNLSSWPILSLVSGSKPPSSIATRLLIGADGFNSPVRTYAGISSHGWDYSRHGVVATLATEAINSSISDTDSLFTEDSILTRATAYQRFLPALGGPIALLPLPDDHASLVWSTTTQNAAYLKSLSEDAFIAIVNAAFRLAPADLKYMFKLPSTDTSPHETELRWRLPHTSSPLHPQKMPPRVIALQPNTVASFPLRFRQASTYTAPRVALCGDAAHTIHPLAGQGLNLGLADARELAKTIEFAVEHGMDLGDSMTLERYGKARWGAGVKMGGGVDLLSRIYEYGSNQDETLGYAAGWARGLGMKVIGSPWASGLRSWIMRQAEG